MNEDLIRSLTIELSEIIQKNIAAESKQTALKALQEKVELLLGNGKMEGMKILAGIHEARGNMYAQKGQTEEADREYRETFELSRKLFDQDQKLYDLLYAQACLRMGVFYRSLLGINYIPPQPAELNENQAKVFNTSVHMYQTCIQFTEKRLKKGDPMAADVAGRALYGLVLLQGAVGKYSEATAISEQLLSLGKSIFQVMDDMNHGKELTTWMTGAAAVYMTSGDYKKSLEILEDCLFVIEDKEEEDPLELLPTKITTLMNLGNCSFLLEEERAQAEAYFQRGLELTETLEASPNSLGQKRQVYMTLAAYYRNMKEEEKAQAFLNKAKAINI